MNLFTISIGILPVSLVMACSQPIEEDRMAESSDSYLSGFSDPVYYGQSVQKAQSGDIAAIEELLTYYTFTRPLDHRNLVYWAEVAFEKGDTFGWLHLAHAELRSPGHGCDSALKTINQYKMVSMRRNPNEYEERKSELEFIEKQCASSSKQ